MLICGLNKTTLLDYPGHVAATVFLGGCNFRCPYCQNKDLLLHPADFAAFTREDVLDHLKKRAGILSGVCITGGEPTLNPDLPDLIKECKTLGYQVKLDTNGTNPDMLIALYEEGLIDYVAMDLKAPKEDYPRVCGFEGRSDEGDLMDKITRSVSFLMGEAKRDGFDFEFRTTVVREFHDADSFDRIADWIGGAPHYFLQSYEDSDGVLVPGLHAHDKKELASFIDRIRDRIPSAALRGVD
ncbi:MAG: anaerobic ribonucleoside-triphosphate reductase activating protein [Lachnospiraceae bacterium]|nr:anaerobic ribonucleoside-triphosphate reductase activating protein [Lachnospiraceae bacterium]